MRKPLLVSLLIGIIVALVGATYLQNGVDIFSFFEWFKSRFRKGVSYVDSTISQSEDGLDIATDFLIEEEKFSAKPYWDVDGYSIGYGHHFVTGDGFTQDSQLTESQAYNLLKSDLSIYDNCVSSIVQQFQTQNQRAASISFCYNVGCGAFKGSTFAKLAKQGSWMLAAEELKKWIYAGNTINAGLKSRREKEKALFLS